MLKVGGAEKAWWVFMKGTSNSVHEMDYPYPRSRASHVTRVASVKLRCCTATLTITAILATLLYLYNLSIYTLFIWYFRG